MATYTIDTHATIKQLEDAGMDSRQAEVVVGAISRSDSELATKVDIDRLAATTKADLKTEIAAVRADIDKLEASTKAEIAGVKADLKIIKYFFGPAIIILLLKIAFFS